MQRTALTCCAVLRVLAKCLVSWERDVGSVCVLLHSLLCNHQSACGLQLLRVNGICTAAPMPCSATHIMQCVQELSTWQLARFIH